MVTDTKSSKHDDKKHISLPEGEYEGIMEEAIDEADHSK